MRRSWRSPRSGRTAGGQTVVGETVSPGSLGREVLADVERQIDEHELVAAGALELVDAVELVADAGGGDATPRSDAGRVSEARGAAGGCACARAISTSAVAARDGACRADTAVADP